MVIVLVYKPLPVLVQLELQLMRTTSNSIVFNLFILVKDSGVFSNCGASLDHGVTLVAFDSTQWVIKNSWGPSWGE
jgi:C1A family cysteine protease